MKDVTFLSKIVYVSYGSTKIQYVIMDNASLTVKNIADEIGINSHIISIKPYCESELQKKRHKVIGAMCICNTASLNVHDIEYGINDYIYVSINSKKVHKVRLDSNDKGMFFTFQKTRYYLDEIEKV